MVRDPERVETDRLRRARLRGEVAPASCVAGHPAFQDRQDVADLQRLGRRLLLRHAVLSLSICWSVAISRRWQYREGGGAAQRSICHGGATLSSTTSSTPGRCSAKVVPTSGALATVRVPPCWRTISRVMASPRPKRRGP